MNICIYRKRSLSHYNQDSEEQNGLWRHGLDSMHTASENLDWTNHNKLMRQIFGSLHSRGFEVFPKTYRPGWPAFICFHAEMSRGYSFF